MKQPFMNPKMMSGMIQQLIRSTLYYHAESTKAELAQRTGISFPTISKALDELNAAGEVLLTGLGTSNGGRRPSKYKLNPDYMAGLAVYLEKEVSVYSLLNYEGDVILRETHPPVLAAGPELLSEQIGTFLARYPALRVLTLGIPAAVNNGHAFHIPGYERFKDFNFKAYYEERFPLSVQVENDMNATVIGYYDHLGNDDSLSLVYLYLGKNGPGAGIIVNGQVVRGRTFFSGEVSYMPLSGTRNFVQLIQDASAETNGDEGRSKLMEAISRLVVSLTATINPHQVVFCSSELTDLDLAHVRTASASLVPQENLPDLVVRNWEEDYVHGLHQLTIRKMLAAD
ncbi:ROK family protein [Paenibacillus rhizovicinus]|uniref:ROK family protein n=1 Tax=Paenibacillus rhizovicinus TaxID=2704463 RepID=A0A6C0P5J8_9BACL|nr:ROK family protein [Paenibacillus rhizovicinus]QHW33830.1 ROK family protein [Paenibacillus rhizovicinus]